jgi:hypothetical protein
MCYQQQLLEQMVFFREIYVFLQLSLSGVVGNKWAFLHLENCDLQEAFLSETHSILTGKQCTRCSISKRDGFLLRGLCISSAELNRLIWSKESLSPH